MYLFKNSKEIAINIHLMPELKREFEGLIGDHFLTFEIHYVSPSEERDPNMMANHWHSPYRKPHTNGMWVMFLLNKGIVSTAW